MLGKKEKLVVHATYGLMILFVIGSMICDFQMIDIVYILGIIGIIVQYMLKKSDD